MYKTCSLLGDSITTFEGPIPAGNDIYYSHENTDVCAVEDIWWKIFLGKSGLELIVNESYSGSKILENGRLPISLGFLHDNHDLLIRKI